MAQRWILGVFISFCNFYREILQGFLSLRFSFTVRFWEIHISLRAFPNGGGKPVPSFNTLFSIFISCLNPQQELKMNRIKSD